MAKAKMIMGDLPIKLEPFSGKGIITHVNGKKLYNPITFGRGDMALLTVGSDEPIIIPDIKWIEFDDDPR